MKTKHKLFMFPHVRQTGCPSILLEGHVLQASETVQNLVVICDKHLLLTDQVSKVSLAASFFLI